MPSTPRGQMCATSPLSSRRSETRRRVMFATPAAVRDALLGLTRGAAPEPFRFILGRAERSTREGRGGVHCRCRRKGPQSQPHRKRWGRGIPRAVADRPLLTIDKRTFRWLGHEQPPRERRPETRPIVIAPPVTPAKRARYRDGRPTPETGPSSKHGVRDGSQLPGPVPGDRRRVAIVKLVARATHRQPDR